MGVAVPVVVLMTAAMTAALRVLVSVPANAAPLGPATVVMTGATIGVLRVPATVQTTAVLPTRPEIAMAGPHCVQKSVTVVGLFVITSAMTNVAQSALPSARATRRAPLK